MLTLHTYFRSSAAYRVRIALNLKGLPYESVPVHLVRDGGQHHQPAFKALNPAELLPVLQTEGHVLTQSLSILEYLEERYPTPALLPGTPEQRAFIRSLALDVACEIHPVNNLRVQQHLTAAFGASDEQRRQWVQHWIHMGFAAIEQRLASQTDPSGRLDHPGSAGRSSSAGRTGSTRSADSSGHFCVGDQPTLADVVLIPQVFNALRFGVTLQDYPRIERVWTHCTQLPAFEAASPARQGDAE